MESEDAAKVQRPAILDELRVERTRYKSTLALSDGLSRSVVIERKYSSDQSCNSLQTITQKASPFPERLPSIIKRNRLRKHFFHHMTVDICEAAVDTILAPSQLCMVDT